MQNFQDTFEIRERSVASAFSICMTVPSKLIDEITVPHIQSKHTKLQLQTKCSPCIANH